MERPRIDVTPEGRSEVWVPERDSLIAWLEAQEADEFHCFLPRQGALIGADWPKSEVIEEVRGALRLGILLGEARRLNILHALSVIVSDPVEGERLEMFDIGDITVNDLQFVPSATSAGGDA